MAVTGKSALRTQQLLSSLGPGAGRMAVAHQYLIHSRRGRSLRAIHGAEVCGQCHGVDTARYKLQCSCWRCAGGPGRPCSHPLQRRHWPFRGLHHEVRALCGPSWPSAAWPIVGALIMGCAAQFFFPCAVLRIYARCGFCLILWPSMLVRRPDGLLTAVGTGAAFAGAAPSGGRAP